MEKRTLAAIAPRIASPEEMQRFSLSDDRCFFIQAYRGKDDLLVISVYHAEMAKRGMKNPALIVFFRRTDFINRLFSETESKYVWRTGCMDNYFPYQASKSLLDEPSCKAIAEFFGEECTFPKVIDNFQQGVLVARLAEKHRKIKAHIDKDMALVPALPKRFEEYVATKAMPQRYMFYDYAKRKTLIGFCTNCRQHMFVETPRHNKTGTCPQCGVTVMYKARGKLSHGIRDEMHVTLPQKIKGGFVLRFFDTWRQELLDDKREIQYFENRRFLYIEGHVSRYIFADFKQTKEYRWCQCTDDLHPYDGWMFPARLDRLLMGTSWQYCTANLYLQSDPHSCLSWYLKSYLEKPYLENLLKNDLPRLAHDFLDNKCSGTVIDRCKTRIHEQLRVSKFGLRVLQEMLANHYHLCIAQTLESAGIMNYSSAFILEILEVWHSDADRYIHTILPYTSNMKAMRYATKLNGMSRRDWLDYVGMAVEVGYDMRKEHAIFPRNLKKAHDTVTWIHREKVAKDSEESFAPHVERLKSYEWKEQDSPYMIVAPERATDIVHEGHRLNHCVHSYIKSVIQGTCAIVFLRESAKPNKPFVTLEIRGSMIHQYRGANNHKPNDEACAFVRKYGQWLIGQKHLQTAA